MTERQRRTHETQQTTGEALAALVVATAKLRARGEISKMNEKQLAYHNAIEARKCDEFRNAIDKLDQLNLSIPEMQNRLSTVVTDKDLSITEKDQRYQLWARLGLARVPNSMYGELDGLVRAARRVGGHEPSAQGISSALLGRRGKGRSLIFKGSGISSLQLLESQPRSAENRFIISAQGEKASTALQRVPLWGQKQIVLCH